MPWPALPSCADLRPRCCPGRDGAAPEAPPVWGAAADDVGAQSGRPGRAAGAGGEAGEEGAEAREAGSGFTSEAVMPQMQMAPTGGEDPPP